MALFTLVSRFKPHQYQYRRIIIPLYISLLLAVPVIPHESLAFEADLTHAKNSAGQFIAQVKLRDGENLVDINQVPDYTNRLANVANAPMNTKTEESKIVERKLGRAIATPVSKAPRILPREGNPLVLQGEASYYSRTGCLGCSPNLTMANGQPLNDNALTMAIGADKSYLVGRQAKVTSLTTGKSVTVRITDTGGFYHSKYGNRVADLTVATKQAIGMQGGVGQVRVEVY